MTVEFDRTAHCQYNHQRLTEFQRILTEQFWLFFDRTTIPTEHLRKLGFDRTVNWKMFCQKNALLGILCHILHNFQNFKSIFCTLSGSLCLHSLVDSCRESLLVIPV